MTTLSTAPANTITINTRLTYTTRAWDLYQRTMQPLAAQAAQRHMLTREEFDDIMSDERIEKHLAIVDGQLVGLGTSTNQLEAWPLISPDYYRAQFPNRQVWYIGFVIVAPKSLGVLGPLIDSLSAQARRTGGVTACDFCTYNLNKLQISVRIDTLLYHLDPTANLAAVDTQQFHAWTFEAKQ